MNDLQIFENSEFGSVRTITVDGEPYFVGIDVADKLEYQNGSRDINAHVDECDRKIISLFDGKQNRKTTIINESGFYSLVFQSKMKKAKEFKHWVTSEVLPSIRKTGSYNKPMTTSGQIQLLAQGYTELEQEVNNIKDDVSELKDNVPLYSCDIDEIQQHVKRRVVNILGGKRSEAYRDNSIRHKTFSDIWTQLKREYGCVSTYKSIKRKYIDDVHEFIDCYVVPKYLDELIQDANAQQSFA
mgnify:CR=1 FL=1